MSTIDRRTLARRLAFGACSSTALDAGVWFGEAGTGISGAQSALITALVIACVAAAIPARLMLRMLAVVVVLVASALGWWCGDREETAAFNECVAHGEEVRVSLSLYRRAIGRYPTSLSELGTPVPCRRLLRGTLLQYEPSAEGYSLWFRDWLVTHEATESHGFGAHK